MQGTFALIASETLVAITAEFEESFTPVTPYYKPIPLSLLVSTTEKILEGTVTVTHKDTQRNEIAPL